jgi:pimeloyl-ACP methyl ester carboxylesterase
MRRYLRDTALGRSLRGSGALLDALAREARALARQATLLHRDVTTVLPARGASDVVVLVHGFLATAGVLRPLRERLEAEAGLGVASFTHPPGIGIREVAARVGELVARVSAERVHLIGHSIGGLAARWFVQELGGDPRVVQTISIATPYWGVRRAWLLPGELARELEPSSALLATLREGLGRGVPHVSLSGTHDVVVGRPEALAAEHALALGMGHNAILYDDSVLSDLVARVRRARIRPL